MEKAINARIAQYRKNAGFTQSEAAQSLGIKRNTYARMELKGSPKPEMLVRLADLYHVSVNNILYGEQAVAENQIQSGDPEVHQSRLQQNLDDSPLFNRSAPFIPTAKEEKIIKIIRNLPKKNKEAVLQYIEVQFKGSKE